MFGSQAELDRHTAAVHNDDDDEEEEEVGDGENEDYDDHYCECDKCDEVFDCQTDLDDHIAESHDGDDEGDRDCDICGESFQ